MVALIDEYRNELSGILGFAEDTVQNYVSCIVMFCGWVKRQFHISPTEAQGSHVCKWMMELKQKGLSYSRLEHHKSALKTFYAMLVKLKIVRKNIALSLPPLRKRGISRVKPVSKDTLRKLLDVVDQSSWVGKRNYMIVSMLWSLGLRISELTGLTVGSFEPDHDPKSKIGLLRVKGKNRKQRLSLLLISSMTICLPIWPTLSHQRERQIPSFLLKAEKPFQTTVYRKRSKNIAQRPALRRESRPMCSGIALPPRCITRMFHWVPFRP